MVWLRKVRGRPPRAEVNELYPNRFATSREYPALGDDTASRDSETFGLRCAQCGFPIKDTRQVETCPNCTSDNFKGEDLAR